VSIDLTTIDPILGRYGAEKGALIPVLQEVQALFGYLPKEALEHIGDKMKVPLSRIYGVVTFYAQFYLTPRGRHTIRVCRGTACHVRGGRSVLNMVKDSLGIDDGETTEDLQFSLETVACLGTCFLAPVMMVDRSYYGKLLPERVPSVLAKFAQGGSRG
jgi:NADH:ubiquinone oxidoreductase subunit E